MQDLEEEADGAAEEGQAAAVVRPREVLHRVRRPTLRRQRRRLAERVALPMGGEGGAADP